MEQANLHGVCELPLPPNWEAKFDSSSQQWFFVNHAGRVTTWEDPRPTFYCNRYAKEHSLTNSTASAAVHSPSSPRGISQEMQRRSRSSSRVHEEIEEDYDKTQEFLEYFEALRSAYPDRNQSQLAKLLEEFLGDSPALRRFIYDFVDSKGHHSTRVHGKKMTSGSSSHHTTTRSAKSPTTCSSTTQPKPLTSEIQHSLDSPLADSLSHDKADDHGHIKKPECSTAVLEHSDYVNTLTPIDTIRQSIESPESEQNVKCKEVSPSPSQSVSTEPTVKEIPLHYRIFDAVDRVKPVGPDSAIRVNRVTARGPDPLLFKGPYRRLVKHFSDC